MKYLSVLMLAALLVAFAGVVSAQEEEEMTMEQWQQEIQKYTQMRDELNARLKALNEEIAAKTAESTNLDEAYRKCMDELYGLVGADAQKAAAFSAEIAAAEAKANEMTRLSDADLVARSAEVDELAATVNKLWENKLSLVPEFWDRLTALNEKVKSLQAVLAAQAVRRRPRMAAEQKRSPFFQTGSIAGWAPSTLPNAAFLPAATDGR